MGKVRDAVARTMFVGLMVLLPLLLFQLLVGEIFQLVVQLATPLTGFLPKSWVEAINAPVLVAIILLVAASLVLGVAASSAVGRRFGSWIERVTLGRIPLYRVLKGFAERLIEFGQGTAFQPALFDSGDGQREYAYLIEDHGDGSVTIMLPWSPTPMSGSLKIVPRESVQLLQAKFGDMTRVLSHWGVGSGELLRNAEGSRAGPGRRPSTDPVEEP